MKLKPSKMLSLALFLVVAFGPTAFRGSLFAEETAGSPTRSAASVYAPGVYKADAQGNNGRVYVEVKVGKDKIESIKVDANYETKGLGTVAAAKVADRIVEGQTLVVDAVAGATLSSEAVVSAVKEALLKSGSSIDALLAPPQGPYGKELEAVKADVVVVGGGMAGMVAAVRAAQEGVSVVLLEKSGILGGAARYAMGWISGADFNIQRKQGVTTDSPDLFYADIIRFAGGEKNVNVPLAKYYAYNSGPAIDWLEKNGVQFKNELNVGIYDPMSVYRVAWGLKNGASLIAGLQTLIDDFATQGKIRCMLFTEGTDLIMDKGAVVGVRAKDRRGNTRSVNAKSVILATGGFGASKKHLEAIFKNISRGYVTTALGSTIDLAEQAGAGFHTMNYNPITGGVLPVDGFFSNVRMNVKYNGVIFVDLNGKRVFDEIGSNYKSRSDAWIKADQNILYAVLSESMLNKKTPVLNAGNAWITTADTDWAIFNRLVDEGKLIVKAESLERLAASIGMDAAQLTATVNRYNGFVKAGKDADFGRTANLIAFDEGPFYAIKTIPYAGRSAGGPLANERMEVLTKKGAVIPGLYVAGEAVGFAVISGEASISGMYLGEAATYGICAAVNAAAYARK